MKKLFAKLKEIITEITSISLTFLCLLVIVQLLINDKLLGWDPVGNIQNAGSSFIGVIALVVLYLLFLGKKSE